MIFYHQHYHLLPFSLRPPFAKTLFLSFSHSSLALMVGGVKLELSPTIIELFLLALPTKSRMLCSKFNKEYSSLRDFHPHAIGLFLYEDF